MIYLLIPFYNEEKNLPQLLKGLNLATKDKDVFYVFSDDGSTDGGIAYLKQNLASSKYHIISDGHNHGPGIAFNKGFNWILTHSKQNNDVVVTIEADSTSDLSILETMLILNKHGYDLVLASVYAQGGGFSKTSFFRKLVSSIANLLFRYVYDLKVLTLSSFYRVYSVRLLKRIKSNGPIIKESGFICMLELLLKAVRNNAKIIEVPMVLKSDTRIGKSKLKVFKTTITYLKFLFKNIKK